MESFYIITNQLKDRDYSVTIEVKDYIERKGKRVILAQKDEEGFIVPGTIPEDVDCGLVLGGDGTLIRAIRDLEGNKLPLLGINIGTLGYLADVELKDYKSAIDRLCEEEPKVEKRMMLEGTMSSGEKDLAVNDIVLTRDGDPRVLKLKLYVDGQFLNEFSADGMIVATPTGSTAYNLSAGGPIAQPDGQLMILTPICPHTLTSRTIVFGAGSRIRIEIPATNRGSQVAAFDGDTLVRLENGDYIEITKAETVTRVVKLDHRSFLDILKTKMYDA